jgi:hypothetical protein
MRNVVKSFMKHKKVLAMGIVAIFIALLFFTPLVPLGDYRMHYPPPSVNPTYPNDAEYGLPLPVFEQTVCAHTLCPIFTLYGQSYVSISYSYFGIGEYLFIEAHQRYCWAFIW